MPKKGQGEIVRKGPKGLLGTIALNSNMQKVDLGFISNMGKEGTVHMWEEFFCASDAESEMV